MQLWFIRGERLPGNMPEDACELYRKHTIDCLVLADYSKPKPYTLETFVLFLQADYYRSADTQAPIWMLLGIITRLAFRMGYHRDPKHYPNISAFDGEMRRRVWAVIFQIDVLSSFQLGLPSMIRMDLCDTMKPRALLDSDFDEDTPKLPPSRSPNDPVPVLYEITKSGIMTVLGQITLQTLGLRPQSYDQVMRLDAKVRDAHTSIPPHLRKRRMHESVADDSNLVMKRFSVELLCQKALCILHRGFLTQARMNPRYAYSRRACIEAAMEILDVHSIVYEETQEMGRLPKDRWFLSSLNMQDFILAAMIICLDLHQTSSGTHLAGDVSLWGTDKSAERVKSLEKSYNIFTVTAEQSVEAYRASQVLAVMLRKLKNGMMNAPTWPRASTARGLPMQDTLVSERNPADTAPCLWSPFLFHTLPVYSLHTDFFRAHSFIYSWQQPGPLKYRNKL